MHKIYHLSLLAYSLIVLGCSSFDVQHDYDPTTDFSTFTSYHLKSDLKIPGDVLQKNDFVRQRVYSAVERELQEKGLRQTDEQSADLIIVTYAGVQDKVNLSTYGYSSGPYYGGYGHYGGYYGGSYSTQTVVTHQNEGTVHIDIMDAKKKLLIWKGQGTGIIEESASPKEREQNVNEAVEEILYEFPPKR